MSISPRIWASLGALLLTVATGLSAYHAHGLQDTLDEQAYRGFGRAVEQQFFAGLGLLGLGLWLRQAGPSVILQLACGLLTIGILLFAGDVYLGALSGNALGVAPMGGSAMILAWLLAAIGLLHSKS